MSNVKVWSFYSNEIGVISPSKYTGPEEFLEGCTPTGFSAIEGNYDGNRFVFDLSLNKIAPKRPDDTIDTYYTWNENSQDWEANDTDVKLDREARLKRSQLFSTYDWVTLRSMRTGTPIPQDWQTFMQELADITNQPGYPRTIQWPIPPV